VAKTVFIESSWLARSSGGSPSLNRSASPRARLYSRTGTPSSPAPSRWPLSIVSQATWAILPAVMQSGRSWAWCSRRSTPCWVTGQSTTTGCWVSR